MVDLTYSELIYLFGDKHLSDRARLVNYDSHPSGVKLPVGKLAQVMVTAAVVYLTEKGYIELFIKNVKKLLIFPGKSVFAKKIKEGGKDLTGIEFKLLNYIKDEAELFKAVYYLLSFDSSSPWGHIIHISKKSMEDKKVLQVEKKTRLIFSVKRHVYNPAILSQYASSYEKVKEALANFSKQTEMFKRVSSAIKSGMKARKEQTTDD